MTDTSSRRLTPDEVLHALRHLLQFDSELPFPNPDAVWVSAEMSVREFDGVRTTDGRLGDCLNSFFGLDVSAAEWGRELATGRTLGDLSSFLSGRIPATPVERFSILDRPCLAGGVFLTLKARLAAAGADVRRLSPSTPLRRLHRHFGWYAVIREAALIAPDRLPLLEPNRGATLSGGGYAVGCLLFWIGLAVAGVFGGSVVEEWIPAAFAIAALVFGSGVMLSLVEGPSRFPGLRTVRDLCKQLAGEPIDRPTRLPGV